MGEEVGVDDGQRVWGRVEDGGDGGFAGGEGAGEADEDHGGEVGEVGAVFWFVGVEVDGGRWGKEKCGEKNLVVLVGTGDWIAGCIDRQEI